MLALKDNFGMGIFPVPFYAKRGFGHSGGIDGFNAMLIYFPEDELSYAITSNALNYTFNDIHIAVLSGIYGMPFDLPNFEAITLKPEDLVKYTGVYSNSQLPIKLTVRIKTMPWKDRVPARLHSRSKQLPNIHSNSPKGGL